MGLKWESICAWSGRLHTIYRYSFAGGFVLGTRYCVWVLRMGHRKKTKCGVLDSGGGLRTTIYSTFCRNLAQLVTSCYRDVTNFSLQKSQVWGFLRNRKEVYCRHSTIVSYIDKKHIFPQYVAGCYCFREK